MAGPIDIIQHSFTRGVISPLLASRTDLELYGKALYSAKNTIILPQGAIRNRWGSDYIDAFDSGAIIAAEYKYSESKKFLVIFVDEKIHIYLDDVLQKTLTSTPYTETMIGNHNVKYVSTLSGLVIVGDGTVAPQVLERGVNDTTWTLSDLVLKNPPSFDFKEDYFDYHFYLDNLDVGESTLTSDTDVFSTFNVGGEFYGPGDKDTLVEGYARIKSYIDPKNVKISIIQAFSNQFHVGHHTGGGMIGDQCILTESAFNSTYGYPTCVTFYESRLFFAATTSLPSTIFGSQINSPYDFSLGSGEDTGGLIARLSGEEFIKNIVGDFSLQIFTDEAEYATLQSNGMALTPSNLSIRKMGTFGSSTVLASVCDSQTFFVREKGSGIASFAYAGGEGIYQSLPISIFSDNIISNPVCLTTYKGKELTDSNYLFIVNDDGTMAVYQSLKAENISAFFVANLDDQEPDGVDESTYKYATSVGRDIYFIVERTISGTTYNYIEKANFDSNFDSSIIITSGTKFTVVTGLSHLEGLTVNVKGDGYLLENEVVSGGQITITRSSTSVEVGLWSPSYIELLPFTYTGRTGNNRYSKRRTNEFIVDYVDTCPNSLKSNGKTFPEEAFYNALPYDPVNDRKVTNQYYIPNVQGWDINNRLVIEQAYPYDFIIIAVCARLGV